MRSTIQVQTGLDRRGWVVIFSVFIAMTGYGITLPVLPVFVDRLDLGPLADAQRVAVHVGAMTAAYAGAQLATSAIWGRLTDRLGARSILLTGLVGFAIGQLLFGLSTKLEILYAARLLAGGTASALITASSAFIASEAHPTFQARAFAWKGMASSLGVVAGPVLGGLLVRPGTREAVIHLPAKHLVLDGFSYPFLSAGILAVLTIPAVFFLVRDSVPPAAARNVPRRALISVAARMIPVLSLSFLGALALAMFEAVLALYGVQQLTWSAALVGVAFAVCGLVMAVMQVVVMTVVRSEVRKSALVSHGFLVSGIGLLLMVFARAPAAFLPAITLMAVGIAAITPILLSASARRSYPESGTGLGLQNAVNGAGQVVGPIVGVFLLGVSSVLPFVAASALCLAAAVVSRHRSVSANLEGPSG